MGGRYGTESSRAAPSKEFAMAPAQMTATFAAPGWASGATAVLDAVAEGALHTREAHGKVGRVRGAKGDRNHALVVVAFG